MWDGGMDHYKKQRDILSVIEITYTRLTPTNKRLDNTHLTGFLGHSDLGLMQDRNTKYIWAHQHVCL
jgi:hypothetical protein